MYSALWGRICRHRDGQSRCCTDGTWSGVHETSDVTRSELIDDVYFYLRGAQVSSKAKRRRTLHAANTETYSSAAELVEIPSML